MRGKAKEMEVVSVRGNKVRYTPVWRRILRIAAVALLLLRIALLIANGLGYRLFLGGMGQRIPVFILDVLLLFAALFSIPWNRKLLFLPAALGTFLGVLYGTNVFSYGKDIRYYVYSSPQKENCLIVEENAFLFRGDVRFYQRENHFFIRNTGYSIHFDDGYRSFESGDFSLSWAGEDRAVITGPVYGMNTEGSITIPF